MLDLKLLDEMHGNISHSKDGRENDLAMSVDNFVRLLELCDSSLPSDSGFKLNEGTLAMDYCIATSMAVDLCRNLSFLVGWENENETQKLSTNDGNRRNHSCARTILALSRLIMEFLATDIALNLPVEEIDRMVLEGLLNAYRLPSVVNNFETETINFYEWWRHRIKFWIEGRFSTKSQRSDCYQQLGWRHLAAMIRETQNHLRPPPTSIMVTGARSKEVNGNYKLMDGVSSSKTNGGVHRNEKQRWIYYSRKVTYENTTSDGRTFSLCLSRVDHSPTSTSHTSSGYSLWFLTELDEEQPNTDCDTDYYCALPRNGKHTRPNPIPPLDGWKRCSHGLFPPPKLVPYSQAGVRIGGGDSLNKHWKHLARWILEEDLLSTCLWWFNHKPRSEAVDSGVTLVLEFLIEIYEEEGCKNAESATNASLGTEFIVKFAASCLERHE